MSLRAEVLPLSSVPYDNMTLPLVSPDARYVATEIGVAPKWSSILAEPSAELPIATRVEVYRIHPGDTTVPSATEAVASRRGPILLGRSVSQQGFLVEAPQADDSRWIGMMSWQTGDVDWLVAGKAVNAFASLGPGGRLAWSRRATDGEHFELVLRHNQHEMVVPADGGDWLMPQWSGTGDGLFVLRLEQQRLMAGHADASDLATFDLSWQSIPLTDNATVFTAFQTLAGHISVADIGTPQTQQLSLYHPKLRQAVLWRPFTISDQRIVTFEPTAMQVMSIPASPLALVTTEKELLRQMIGAQTGIPVVKGLWMPRRTPAAPWSYTLLAPAEGRIGLTALQLHSME